MCERFKAVDMDICNSWVILFFIKTSYSECFVRANERRYIEMSDGTWEMSDGTLEMNDGTWEMSDGMLEMSDGTLEMSDGTLKMNDGTSLGNDSGLTVT